MTYDAPDYQHLTSLDNRHFLKKFLQQKTFPN